MNYRREQTTSLQEKRSIQTRVRVVILALYAIVCLALATVPALADTLYSSGPLNGVGLVGGIDYGGAGINYGFEVSDPFTVTADSTVTGFDFADLYWPNDLPYTVTWSISTGPFDGFVWGKGTAYLSNTFLYFDPVESPIGYNIGDETVSGLDVQLPAGSYWLTLQNAASLNELPMYWGVEGVGIDCPRIHCPLPAFSLPNESILAEAFTINGTSATPSTASVPEPSSLILLGSGIIGFACVFRRDLTSD